VHNTLVTIATNAVASLTPRPAVTVGPLDRDHDGLRLNWFLYSVHANPAYSNMEPPRTGTRSARGNPPLALELGYVLTAHPGTMTLTGEQAQFADRSLTAVMQALHDRPIIGDGEAELAPEAGPLVEPLRITMDSLDLESVSKIWTAATHPMRTTVGYKVSLAIVDTTRVHVPGPPVRERRIGAVPSIGPRFESVTPTRISAASPATAVVTGATGTPTFSIRREPDDVAGSGDWPVVATATAPGRFELQVAPDDLAPGARQLSVVTTVDGLDAGGDRIGVTLVPTVVATSGPVAAGASVTLTTAHVGATADVFLDGVRLDDGDVTVVSPTQIDVVVPAATTAGSHRLMLRSAHTAGPEFDGLVVT
jgi:hypothetical protein